MEPTFSTPVSTTSAYAGAFSEQSGKSAVLCLFKFEEVNSI